MWASYRAAFAAVGKAPKPPVLVLARPAPIQRLATSARAIASKGGAGSRRGLELDPDVLEEARAWKASKALTLAGLPKGDTAYSRSSGPGGQHANKSVSFEKMVLQDHTRVAERRRLTGRESVQDRE